MTTPAGSPGTAGRDYRIPVKEGRHRAPPEPPPPDRFVAPIAAAAVLLTAASLIAIYATGIAPDASAATGNGVSVSTAARSARTVSVPLTVLPATPPSIGAEGAWDPETDAPIPSAPRDALQTWGGATASATATTKPATVTTGQGNTTTAANTTTQTTPTTAQTIQTTATRTTTATSPTSTSAAASTTSSATTTEETPVSSEPTQTTDPIGDIVDEVLGETP